MAYNIDGYSDPEAIIHEILRVGRNEFLRSMNVDQLVKYFDLEDSDSDSDDDDAGAAGGVGEDDDGGDSGVESNYHSSDENGGGDGEENGGAKRMETGDDEGQQEEHQEADNKSDVTVAAGDVGNRAVVNDRKPEAEGTGSNERVTSTTPMMEVSLEFGLNYGDAITKHIIFPSSTSWNGRKRRRSRS